MAAAQRPALAAPAALIFLVACQTIVVHYEWSADRRHVVRVLEEGIDQFVERDGSAEPSYRAIGVESLVLSADGAHLAYPALTAAGWEVVFDGKRSRAWRGIGEIALGSEGTHLAYAALDDDGWRVVRDGALGPIADAIMSNTLALSPDGKRLAYVARRGAMSFLHLDERQFGGFSSIGRPIFSADSARFAFVAARGRSLRVYLDAVQQPQFEEIVELAFFGSRLGYFGLRGDRWHAVMDSVVGPPFELTASLRASGERTAYLAKEQDRWHLLLDGEKRATHDEIEHRTLCFTGEEPRFAARDGKTWSAGGQNLDAIDGLVCSGDRWAYTGRLGARAVVIEGEREVGRYQSADVPVFADDGTLGFIAVEGTAFVQVGERRIEVELPVFGTLVLSPDGEHFAVLSADREKRTFHLVVDGERRKRFDFEEPAALALKNPRALSSDAMRRWVSAELALHLEAR